MGLLKEDQYVTVSDCELLTSGVGSVGVKIMVASDNNVDFSRDQLYDAIKKSSKHILDEVCHEIKINQPDTERETQENRELLDAFAFGDEKIFVEEIPNQYCSEWCCRHLPWFIVTTEVGRIEIGWRKRVISIEWLDTFGTRPAEELFADEDVTKSGKYIHAWSLEKAKMYISRIIETATK